MMHCAQEYTARAQEQVRAMKEQRSRSPYHHRHWPSGGPGPVGSGAAPQPNADLPNKASTSRRPTDAAGGSEGALDSLDRELEAAKQKLQRIQVRQPACVELELNCGEHLTVGYKACSIALVTLPVPTLLLPQIAVQEVTLALL